MIQSQSEASRQLQLMSKQSGVFLSNKDKYVNVAINSEFTARDNRETCCQPIDRISTSSYTEDDFMQARTSNYSTVTEDIEITY